jgi:glycosyltransferase involved in cell wall biosynthesis
LRVLFLSQVLPYPLDAGPKIRSYFVLRHLVGQHDLTLLTFVRDTDRREDIAHLADLCHASHTVPMRRSRLRDLRFAAESLLAQQSFIILRDRSPEMVNTIRQLVRSQRFDVIHADQLWMAQYALAAKAASQRRSAQSTDTDARPKLILDQHNAVHLIPRRLSDAGTHPLKRSFLSREARLLAAYESEMCSQFDHIVWVSDVDRRAVGALSQTTNTGHAASSVIPICTDPAHIHPVVPASERRRITFLGGLHWPPNAQGAVWFANHVFPQVREAIPEAVLTVIGKNPPAGLEREGVEITGYVTDLTPYLAETAVFIVPLHAGGGMRVKILDAWSWGLPIVSTTIGTEGIDSTPEQDILIADTPETFARAVINLFRDRSLAERLGHNGRRAVSEKYNWQVVYSAWDDVYGSLDDGPPIKARPDARQITMEKRALRR